jgi:DNA polymerase III epsilon subunit-like protein
LRTRRTIFIDLETTGLSGGAGTVAFLVGCGYFDLGAFQVRQFLLTSFASERALLHAVADFFDGADLIVTYNGKTFDVPVMETRWLFHRLQMPLTSVRHFDMLHPARRLWRARAGARDPGDSGCRLATLERTLFNVSRVGDVGGFEIPGRFFQFLRSGDPRPLEPVLEHNRLDLVSLAAVMARALELARDGHAACRDSTEALALGRIYERAATDDRLGDRVSVLARAESCYRRAAQSRTAGVRAEALYRLALRHRRERRFAEAAAIWREVIDLTEPRAVRRIGGLGALRHFAAEALAIHHEHRDRDLTSARKLALFAMEEAEAEAEPDSPRADSVRHRLARLNRKLAQKTDAQLFSS